MNRSVTGKTASGAAGHGPARSIARLLAAMGIACLLAACAAQTGDAAGAPEAGAQPVAADAGTTTGTTTGDVPDARPSPPEDIVPPRMSDPLPPEVLPEPATLDRSCRTDADCTVKNVGNCCGYYPSCVNVNSPTDPAGVQAECAARGMSSVCGFPEVSGCQCVSGQCRDVTGGAVPASE
jgi:hypothetical protein